MNGFPLAIPAILIAALLAAGGGCSAMRRPRTEISSEAPSDSQRVPSTGSMAEAPLQAEVVRLPPADSSAELPISAGAFTNHEIATTDSPGSQVLLTHGGFDQSLEPQGMQALYFEAAPSVEFEPIWRLPSVLDSGGTGEDTGITFAEMFKEQSRGVLEDYYQFYSLESLAWLTAGLGAGALMANTGFDEHLVRHTFKENVILAPTHEYAEQLGRPKFFGEGQYTIPVYAIAAFSQPLIEDLPLGEATAEWGQRSFRTLLVGAPPMLALQVLTGGSRPGETSSTSHWKPLDDSNGVSGHSFMGAVPFLSAAKMSDNIWLKSGFYIASTLPAMSRVNDDDHYFSQAFLGWWIAYMAANAVDRSHDPDRHHRFLVYPAGDGFAAGIEYVH